MYATTVRPIFVRSYTVRVLRFSDQSILAVPGLAAFVFYLNLSIAPRKKKNEKKKAFCERNPLKDDDYSSGGTLFIGTFF